MKHGELTDCDLKNALYVLIKEWYEKKKEGDDLWKIVRSDRGDFDICIDHHHNTDILRVRIFKDNESIYKYNSILNAEAFDNYVGPVSLLIEAISIDICKTIRRLLDD